MILNNVFIDTDAIVSMRYIKVKDQEEDSKQLESYAEITINQKEKINIVRTPLEYSKAFRIFTIKENCDE